MKPFSRHKAASLLALLTCIVAPCLGQGNSHNKNSGNTNWTNNGGWDTGNIPGPADTAIINSGALNVSGAQSIGRLRLNGGTLLGETNSSTDSLTINGSESNSEWSEGTIQDITLFISQNGTIDIEGSGTKTLSAAVLQIQRDDGHGIANWTEGLFNLNAGSKLENSGAFNDTADNLIRTFTGTTGTFNNLISGDYNKNGSGTTEIDVIFNNDGDVNIDAGTFVLDGGGEASSTGEFDVSSGATLRFDNNYAIINAANISGDGQVELTNGTLTLDGDVNASDFAIKGGILTGTHTFTNGAIWSEGKLEDGSTTNASGSNFRIQSTADNNLDNHELTNAGTINWTDGDIVTDNGSTLTNSGTFNDSITADHEIRRFTGEAFVFTNSGTYHKTGNAQTEIDQEFNNSGTVDIDAGTLVLDGTGESSSTGSFEVNAGATLRFDNTYSVADASKITGSGQTELTNGTLTLTGNVSSPDFAIQGGALTGTHTFTNGAIWSEGILKNGSTTNASGSNFRIQSTADNNLDNHELTNAGTINWIDGDIVLDNASSITNSGAFNDSISADHEIRRFTGTEGVFSNSGTYHKTGSAKTEFDQEFNNSGTVDLDSGVLVLDGTGQASSTGSFDINAGATLRFDNNYSITDASRITGNGQVELTAGTLSLSGDVNTPDFAIEGGTLTGSHIFNNGAIWSGGILKDGSTTNASGSNLRLQDSIENNLDGHAIINVGTINWTDGDIENSNGSSITNSGTFNDSITDDHEIRRFTGEVMVFANSGLYHKTGSAKTEIVQTFNNTGLVDLDAGVFVIDGGGSTSSTGSFDVSSGATLRFDNNYSVADASKITGAGQVELTNGTLALSGNVNVPNFAIKGGKLGGAVTFQNGAIWSEGVISNSAMTNASGSTFNIQSATDNNFDSASLTNAGTVNWTDGDIVLDNNSALTNTGTFNDSISADHEIRRFTGTTPVISNSGTYHKTGSAKTEIDQVFNNTGTVDIDAGIFVLDGTGSATGSGSFDVASGALLKFDNNYTISDATFLTGLGDFKVTDGTLDLNGQVNVSNLFIDGGNLDGDHTFNAGATLANGQFLSGTTSNASGSTLYLSDTISNVLNDRDINNQSGATINWTAGHINATNGSVINNLGTFNDSADKLFFTSLGTAGSFTNATTGTYNKNGSGTTEFDKTFDNSGTVNVNAGILKLDGGGTASSSGKFDVDSGATLQLDASYSIDDASKLTGSGNFKATAGTLALNGQMQHVSLLIQGATVTGTHAFHQGATLTNGSFGAGQTTVSNNSALNLSDGGGNILDDRDIYIQTGSTLNWTTANIDARNGSFIFLQGTLNDTADAHFTSTSGSGAFLTVSGGTYNKNGPGTTEIDKTFNNYGTVNVNSGILVIDGGGQASSSGTFDVDSGATLKFDSDYAVADAAKLTGEGTFLLSSQDLTLAGVLSSDFEQDGGNLDGTYQISGTFDWRDGLWSAASASGESTTINSGGVLNITDTTSYYNNRNIINNGTVNWTGGTLLTNSVGSFTNNNLFIDNSNSDHNISESTGSSTFTNNGTFRKTGSGTTRIDQTFDSASPETLDVQNGILEINGGGTNYSSGSIKVQNSGLIKFTSNYKIANAANLSVDNLSGNYGYELTGGDLDLDGTLGVDFAQSGGELDGTHSIDAKYNWNGGTLNADSDGESTTINSPGELNINITTLNAEFDNRDIYNYGTVNWNDGNLFTNAQGSFANNGTFNDKLNHDHRFSGAPSFSNTGTYTKSGAGTTEFDSDFDNDGTVNIDAGTLILDGGGLAGSMGTFAIGSTGVLQIDNDYNITDAANLTGAGKVLHSNGDVTLEGDLSVNYQQTGGNLDGSQVISRTFDLEGFADWDAASDGATTEITSTGVLNIGGNSKTYLNRDITNQGTVNWKDGNFVTNAAGSFLNQGNFNDQLDHAHALSFTGSQSTFTNEGTYTKSGNVLTTVSQEFVNKGTLNVQQGTLTFSAATSHAGGSTMQVSHPAFVRFQSGTSTFSDGTINGDGTIRQDSGTISGNATFGTNFEKAGGTMDGTFNFGRTLNYTGGTFSSTSQINLTGNATSSVDASSLNLPGTILDVGSSSTLEWKSGSIHTGSNGALRVSGILLNTFDGTVSEALTGDGALEVSGQFRKTGGSGVTTISLPTTISGRFEAHTGAVTFAHTGTSDGGLFDVWSGAEMNFNNGFTFANGTTVPNGGDFNLKSGTFNITDTVSLGQHASLIGGTITGTHTLSGRVVVTNGSFSGDGATTIANNGTVEFANEEENLMPRSFINNGKIAWSDSDLLGSGDNSLTNEGEFFATTDGTFAADDSDFTVTNNGTFKKSAGTGTTTIDLPFTNNGTVGADTGILHFADSFTFGAGEVALGGGQVTFAQTLSFPSTAKLSGNGTITGNVETNGTVAPGNSIGTVNITGDLTLLASSKSVFEVDASSTPGTADLVNVSGNLVLGGNLSWSLLSTMDPVTTSMFTLYTANNIAGSFANAANGTRLSTSDGHRSFIVNYGSGSAFDANKVIFSSFEFTAVPEPSTWALMFMGIMLMTWQSRRRRS